MTANDIRNIALLGHGGSGKTSLAEQMLFMTKGIDRLGKTADGNTTCDYDAEETKRKISISLAFAPVMYKGKKINVMDAPGNFDFSGEAVCAIRAALVDLPSTAENKLCMLTKKDVPAGNFHTNQ